MTATLAVDVAAVRTSPAVRWVLESLPALAAALVLLPYIISTGSMDPWRPATIDLEVYVYAVRDLLAGRDIYATVTPGWNLFFIYPPIAAILMVPLALGSYAFWQVAWTAGLVVAQQSVLRRCGVPRGWPLALLGVAVVLAVEPIRTTLGYGQVNTLLMALVVADLLPDAPQDRRFGTRGGERRLLPRGTLIGLAAAIKLTPALFVVFAWLAGLRRVAVTAAVAFVAFTGLGAVLMWSETVAFFGGLSGGDTRTASPLYVGNQSLLGVFFRLGDDSRPVALAGLAVAGLVALASAWVAGAWWRRGEQVFAVALVGLGTCLASPLSWTHHYVWVLPMAVAVLTRRSSPAGAGLPRWVRLVGGVWALWVCACLPLAALPYGQGREAGYGPLEQLVANLGPVLGLVLVAGLAGQQVRRHLGARRAPDLAGAHH